MRDHVTRFLLRGAQLRGEIVELDGSWRQVLGRHTLAAPVRDCLGELSAAAALLTATLKLDGALILQIQGDGPVSLMIAECRSDGGYRATVKQRRALRIEDRDLNDLVNAGGRGRFAVTLDPADRPPGVHPYQGIVPLDAPSVAGVLEHYMARSEQLPTRLWLAADARRAVGLLLQRIPAEGGMAVLADSDGWNRMQRLAETLERDEMLASSADTIMRRLFWQEDLYAFDKRPISFRCGCSRAKVADMLKLLGRTEVESIVAEQGQVEVACDFCNQPYRFDRIDASALFAQGLVEALQTRQ